jgi:hypothetical protein
MNRRYVIAGVAVVAVAGLWYMHSQSGSGGGAPSAAAASSAASSTTTTPGAGASTIPTAQLYGATTATAPSPATGTLFSLSAFGTPRDPFIQAVATSASAANSNSLTFGSTPTTSKTAPISLGSGATTAVPSGSTQTSTTGSGGTQTTPTTPTNAPPVQTLAAEFDVNGEPVVAYLGDAIPPDTQQFTVRSITTAHVVLALNGALLANGASSITIKVGQSMTVENQTAHTTVVLHLLSVHAA